MKKNQVRSSCVIHYVDFKQRTNTKVQIISERKQKDQSSNVIKSFFLKNHMKEYLLGEKSSNLDLVVFDETNKVIAIKAMRAIIKTSKSKKKFKFNVA